MGIGMLVQIGREPSAMNLLQRIRNTPDDDLAEMLRLCRRDGRRQVDTGLKPVFAFARRRPDEPAAAARVPALTASPVPAPNGPTILIRNRPTHGQTQRSLHRPRAHPTRPRILTPGNCATLANSPLAPWRFTL